MNEEVISMEEPTMGFRSETWMESISSKFNLDSFLKKFNLTTATLVESIAYFGGGFFVGLFVRRYLKQVLIAIAAFFLIIKGLEYMGVGSMAFNWGRVKDLTGIAPSDTVETVSSGCFLWVQTHVRQVICTLIGFLVGMRV